MKSEPALTVAHPQTESAFGPFAVGRSRRHPIRLAMFPMLTRKDAASRLFCYQWIDPLRAHGVRASVHPPSPVRLFEFLCESRPSPLAAVRKLLYWYGIVPLARTVELLAAASSDVVFIQRGMLHYRSAPVLESLLAALRDARGRPRLIYQYDDALYLYCDPRHYQRRFQMADVVLTGNEELAAYARQWARDVRILEAAVDLEYYRPNPERPSTDGVTTIGWAGTNTADLESMSPVIDRVANRVPIRFRVVGPRQTQWTQREHWEFVPWTLAHEINNLAAFDIGVMPLADTEYSRAKEGYKLKQYMAMGLPTVASAVGKNRDLVRDGVTGFLVSDTGEWVARLVQLASEPELRRRMGQAGRRFVEERYGIAEVAPELAGIVRELARG